MASYFLLIIILAAIYYTAGITRKKGFDNLSVHREVSSASIMEGEKIHITITVENKKWLPISFLYIIENIPNGLQYPGKFAGNVNGTTEHAMRYTILWYERVKKTYSLIGEKRGVYLFRNMAVTIGDFFGLSAESKKIDDYMEIIVFPKIIKMNEVFFNNKSLMGDTAVKRWLHEDPLYIRGIREYRNEDRMKDIHWKSSLRMNKLMVKEYDHTSDIEVAIIVNVQADEYSWRAKDTEITEKGIRLGASLAAECIKQCFPTGMWTNAYVKCYRYEYKSEVQPSLNSFRNIMELCARMDNICKNSFDEYLEKMIPNFKQDCVYIVITSFLNSKCVNILKRLSENRINIKIIDISRDESVSTINHIEKISCRGEEKL